MKIFWLTIVSVFVFVFAVSITIQLPQVQTVVANKALSSISDKIQGNISFEKIHFKPFTTLVLKNVLITDNKPVADPATGAQVDTFFQAQYIIARFTLDGLFRQESLHLDKAFIRNAQMNLVLEDNTNPNSDKVGTDNLSRIFSLKNNPQKEKSDKELFLIKKIEIQDMGFAMLNHRTVKSPYHGGINWNDFLVKDLDINGHNLHYKDGKMSGIADRISFTEKSGWVCEEISGKAKVGRGQAIIENLRIKDTWSDLYLPLYMMSFSSPKDFSDYVHKVKMDAQIAPSDFDFKTLTYFSPQLEGNDLKVRISGQFSGHIDDFAVNTLSISSYAGGFSGKLDGRITGLTDEQDFKIDARLNDFLMTADGLGKFVSEWMKGNELNLSNYAKGTTFSVRGRARGRMNNLSTNISISSKIGKAHAGIRLRNLLNNKKPLGFSGTLSTDDLDIGGVIGTDMIRQISLETGFKAEIGSGLSFPEVTIDSLEVERLVFNDYDYSNIAAEGEIKDKSFNGKILCNDPSLSFMFDGSFALAPKRKNAVYKFEANIGYADLYAINVDKRGRSEISLFTNADIRHIGGGEITGTWNIEDISLTNSIDRYNIGDINVTSYSKEKDYQVDFISSFAEGSYSGSASATQFVRDLQNVLFKKELPALFQNPEYTWKGNGYKAELRFLDMIDLLSFVAPGVYIESGTSIYADIDKDGTFNSSIKSGRLAFRKQYLKGFSALINNTEDNLNADIICDEVQFATLKLSDNHLQVYANDNHIGTGYTYDNHSNLQNRGEFFIHGDLTRQNDSLSLGIDIKQSKLYLNSREWSIQPATMKISGSDIYVNSFCLTSGDEAIRIDGAKSDSRRDTLNVGLQRFDVSMLNSVIPGFGLDGALSGTATLISPMVNMGFEADLICDSTNIADVPLGILHIGSSWNNASKSLSLAARNQLGELNSLDANAVIHTQLGSIDGQVNLNGMNIGYVQPIVKDIFNEMTGSLSGNFTLSGPFSNLDISSTGARLENGMFKVAYTNVPYFADGTFHVDSKGAYFDNLKIRDRYNGTGEILGSINWDHFRDITFDTRFKVDQIEGINLTEDMSETFYGNVFASGNIALTGPATSLRMNIDAVTAKPGQIHIPLSSGASAGHTNLLKFTERETYVYVDPYEAMMTDLQNKESKQSEFNLKMRVNAQPDVEAYVEIDKASGNVLNGRGSGILDLEVDADDFKINGDYTLSGGNYKFVAMGLVSRDFEIQEGSSIRFMGDILESTLDINAQYKTKASLSTLISDTTSVANRRTVECGISITEQIKNPRLSFSIEIPDLDPTIKSRVESALSTEDKVQKQFLSLILSNSFLPDEQSGIANNSSMLYSNVTEMLANQLSNILQKLDIPLDLGLNYQPNEKGNDIFDVAVSTQLFNNRVAVNGSVGNKQYGSGGTQDVVGDLDIEIKIDRSGSFRLNLFSHSADTYTNYLDNSQRNGVGLTYQTEFNKFSQFFKNLFASKQKRQASKIAEEQAMMEEGKIEIIIEPTDRNDRQ